jgi:hypothetical protein
MIPKMCGFERVGICFVLLCVMHTHSGKKLMLKEIKERKISLKRFKTCLKLYLLFEHWVNEPHPWSQVRQSSIALGNLINLIIECFPRDEGWGWNLLKMQAFTKIPHNMLKFGSANNFLGNIGERVLKGIIKDHVEKHKGNRINLQNNVLYMSMKAMLSNTL